MAVEMLVGLNVVDNDVYQAYRNEMTPILKQHEGGFGYDLRVSEVLKSVTDAPINRVFTICFPSHDVMESFFSNDAYLKIKQRHFEGAVTHTTLIATYER